MDPVYDDQDKPDNESGLGDRILPSVSFRCCPVFQFPAGFPNGGVNRFLIQ
jgi:hypothetical protein